jgi:sugar phosphate isomerase/epimerase
MNDLPVFSVSQFSTGPRTFEEDIEAYVRAGVPGIEVCEEKLSRDPDQARDQMALLMEAGLKVTSVQARVHTPLPNVATADDDPWQPEDRLASFKASIDFFVQTCPGESLTFISPSGRAHDSDFCAAHRVARQFYGELADHARDHGARICLEPLGSIFMNLFGFICTLDEAMAIIHDVGRPNFGLTLDVYHVWREHLLAERLNNLGAHIFAVHVCDWPASEPRCRDDRALPGDGVIDLPVIFGAVERSGYDGAYCLEIFSDESLPDSLWTMDPVELIQRGQRGFAEAWRQRR